MSTPLHRLAPLGVALVLSTAGLAACGSNSDNSSSSKQQQQQRRRRHRGLQPRQPAHQWRARRRPWRQPRQGHRQGRGDPARHHLVDALHALRRAAAQEGLTAAGLTARRAERRWQHQQVQASIAQSMIGEGVKVLIIDSIDAPSGVGVEKQADPGRREGHRLRPRQPRRHRGLLRVLRQRGRRQAAGPDHGRLPQRAGRVQAEDHHDGRRQGRRQQRGPLRQGRPRGARPAGGRRASSRSCPSRSSRAGPSPTPRRRSPRR